MRLPVCDLIVLCLLARTVSAAPSPSCCKLARNNKSDLIPWEEVPALYKALIRDSENDALPSSQKTIGFKRGCFAFRPIQTGIEDGRNARTKKKIPSGNDAKRIFNINRFLPFALTTKLSRWRDGSKERVTGAEWKRLEKASKRDGSRCDDDSIPEPSSTSTATADDGLGTDEILKNSSDLLLTLVDKNPRLVSKLLKKLFINTPDSEKLSSASKGSSNALRSTRADTVETTSLELGWADDAEEGTYHSVSVQSDSTDSVKNYATPFCSTLCHATTVQMENRPVAGARTTAFHEKADAKRRFKDTEDILKTVMEIVDVLNRTAESPSSLPFDSNLSCCSSVKPYRHSHADKNSVTVVYEPADEGLSKLSDCMINLARVRKKNKTFTEDGSKTATPSPKRPELLIEKAEESSTNIEVIFDQNIEDDSSDCYSGALVTETDRYPVTTKYDSSVLVKVLNESDSSHSDSQNSEDQANRNGGEDLWGARRVKLIALQAQDSGSDGLGRTVEKARQKLGVVKRMKETSMKKSVLATTKISDFGIFNSEPTVLPNIPLGDYENVAQLLNGHSGSSIKENLQLKNNHETEHSVVAPRADDFNRITLVESKAKEFKRDNSEEKNDPIDTSDEFEDNKDYGCQDSSLFGILRSRNKVVKMAEDRRRLSSSKKPGTTQLSTSSTTRKVIGTKSPQDRQSLTWKETENFWTTTALTELEQSHSTNTVIDYSTKNSDVLNAISFSEIVRDEIARNSTKKKGMLKKLFGSFFRTYMTDNLSNSSHAQLKRVNTMPPSASDAVPLSLCTASDSLPVNNISEECNEKSASRVNSSSNITQVLIDTRPKSYRSEHKNNVSKQKSAINQNNQAFFKYVPRFYSPSKKTDGSHVNSTVPSLKGRHRNNSVNYNPDVVDKLGNLLPSQVVVQNITKEKQYAKENNYSQTVKHDDYLRNDSEALPRGDRADTHRHFNRPKKRKKYKNESSTKIALPTFIHGDDDVNFSSVVKTKYRYSASNKLRPTPAIQMTREIAEDTYPAQRLSQNTTTPSLQKNFDCIIWASVAPNEFQSATDKNNGELEGKFKLNSSLHHEHITVTSRDTATKNEPFSTQNYLKMPKVELAEVKASNYNGSENCSSVTAFKPLNLKFIVFEAPDLLYVDSRLRTTQPYTGPSARPTGNIKYCTVTLPPDMFIAYSTLIPRDLPAPATNFDKVFMSSKGNEVIYTDNPRGSGSPATVSAQEINLLKLSSLYFGDELRTCKSLDSDRFVSGEMEISNTTKITYDVTSTSGKSMRTDGKTAESEMSNRRILSVNGTMERTTISYGDTGFNGQNTKSARFEGTTSDLKIMVDKNVPIYVTETKSSEPLEITFSSIQAVDNNVFVVKNIETGADRSIHKDQTTTKFNQSKTAWIRSWFNYDDSSKANPSHDKTDTWENYENILGLKMLRDSTLATPLYMSFNKNVMDHVNRASSTKTYKYLDITPTENKENHLIKNYQHSNSERSHQYETLHHNSTSENSIAAPEFQDMDNHRRDQSVNAITPAIARALSNITYTTDEKTSYKPPTKNHFKRPNDIFTSVSQIIRKEDTPSNQVRNGAEIPHQSTTPSYCNAVRPASWSQILILPSMIIDQVDGMNKSSQAVKKLLSSKHRKGHRCLDSRYNHGCYCIGDESSDNYSQIRQISSNFSTLLFKATPVFNKTSIRDFSSQIAEDGWNDQNDSNRKYHATNYCGSVDSQSTHTTSPLSEESEARHAVNNVGQQLLVITTPYFAETLCHKYSLVADGTDYKKSVCLNEILNNSACIGEAEEGTSMPTPFNLAESTQSPTTEISTVANLKKVTNVADQSNVSSTSEPHKNHHHLLSTPPVYVVHNFIYSDDSRDNLENKMKNKPSSQHPASLLTIGKNYNMESDATKYRSTRKNPNSSIDFYDAAEKLSGVDRCHVADKLDKYLSANIVKCFMKVLAETIKLQDKRQNIHQSEIKSYENKKGNIVSDCNWEERIMSLLNTADPINNSSTETRWKNETPAILHPSSVKSNLIPRSQTSTIEDCYDLVPLQSQTTASIGNKSFFPNFNPTSSGKWVTDTKMTEDTVKLQSVPILTNDSTIDISILKPLTINNSILSAHVDKPHCVETLVRSNAVFGNVGIINSFGDSAFHQDDMLDDEYYEAKPVGSRLSRSWTESTAVQSVQTFVEEQQINACDQKNNCIDDNVIECYSNVCPHSCIKNVSENRSKAAYKRDDTAQTRSNYETASKPTSCLFSKLSDKKIHNRNEPLCLEGGLGSDPRDIGSRLDTESRPHSHPLFLMDRVAGKSNRETDHLLNMYLLNKAKNKLEPESIFNRMNILRKLGLGKNEAFTASSIDETKKKENDKQDFAGCLWHKYDYKNKRKQIPLTSEVSSRVQVASTTTETLNSTRKQIQENSYRLSSDDATTTSESRKIMKVQSSQSVAEDMENNKTLQGSLKSVNHYINNTIIRLNDSSTQVPYIIWIPEYRYKFYNSLQNLSDTLNSSNVGGLSGQDFLIREATTPLFQRKTSAIRKNESHKLTTNYFPEKLAATMPLLLIDKDIYSKERSSTNHDILQKLAPATQNIPTLKFIDNVYPDERNQNQETNTSNITNVAISEDSSLRELMTDSNTAESLVLVYKPSRPNITYEIFDDKSNKWKLTYDTKLSKEQPSEAPTHENLNGFSETTNLFDSSTVKIKSEGRKIDSPIEFIADNDVLRFGGTTESVGLSSPLETPNPNITCSENNLNILEKQSKKIEEMVSGYQKNAYYYVLSKDLPIEPRRSTINQSVESCFTLINHDQASTTEPNNLKSASTNRSESTRANNNDYEGAVFSTQAKRPPNYTTTRFENSFAFSYSSSTPRSIVPLNSYELVTSEISSTDPPIRPRTKVIDYGISSAAWSQASSANTFTIAEIRNTCSILTTSIPFKGHGPKNTLKYCPALKTCTMAPKLTTEASQSLPAPSQTCNSTSQQSTGPFNPSKVSTSTINYTTAPFNTSQSISHKTGCTTHSSNTPQTVTTSSTLYSENAKTSPCINHWPAISQPISTRPTYIIQPYNVFKLTTKRSFYTFCGKTNCTASPLFMEYSSRVRNTPRIIVEWKSTPRPESNTAEKYVPSDKAKTVTPARKNNENDQTYRYNSSTTQTSPVKQNTKDFIYTDEEPTTDVWIDIIETPPSTFSFLLPKNSRRQNVYESTTLTKVFDTNNLIDGSSGSFSDRPETSYVPNLKLVFKIVSNEPQNVISTQPSRPEIIPEKEAMSTWRNTLSADTVTQSSSDGVNDDVSENAIETTYGRSETIPLQNRKSLVDFVTESCFLFNYTSVSHDDYTDETEASSMLHTDDHAASYESHEPNLSDTTSSTEDGIQVEEIAATNKGDHKLKETTTELYIVGNLREIHPSAISFDIATSCSDISSVSRNEESGDLSQAAFEVASDVNTNSNKQYEADWTAASMKDSVIGTAPDFDGLANSGPDDDGSSTTDNSRRSSGDNEKELSDTDSGVEENTISKDVMMTNKAVQSETGSVQLTPQEAHEIFETTAHSEFQLERLKTKSTDSLPEKVKIINPTTLPNYSMKNITRNDIRLSASSADVHVTGFSLPTTTSFTSTNTTSAQIIGELSNQMETYKSEPADKRFPTKLIEVITEVVNVALIDSTASRIRLEEKILTSNYNPVDVTGRWSLFNNSGGSESNETFTQFDKKETGAEWFTELPDTNENCLPLNRDALDPDTEMISYTAPTSFTTAFDDKFEDNDRSTQAIRRKQKMGIDHVSPSDDGRKKTDSLNEENDETNQDSSECEFWLTLATDATKKNNGHKTQKTTRPMDTDFEEMREGYNECTRKEDENNMPVDICRYCSSPCGAHCQCVVDKKIINKVLEDPHAPFYGVNKISETDETSYCCTYDETSVYQQDPLDVYVTITASAEKNLLKTNESQENESISVAGEIQTTHYEKPGTFPDQITDEAISDGFNSWDGKENSRKGNPQTKSPHNDASRFPIVISMNRDDAASEEPIDKVKTTTQTVRNKYTRFINRLGSTARTLDVSANIILFDPEESKPIIGSNKGQMINLDDIEIDSDVTEIATSESEEVITEHEEERGEFTDDAESVRDRLPPKPITNNIKFDLKFAGKVNKKTSKQKSEVSETAEGDGSLRDIDFDIETAKTGVCPTVTTDQLTDVQSNRNWWNSIDFGLIASLKKPTPPDASASVVVNDDNLLGISKNKAKYKRISKNLMQTTPHRESYEEALAKQVYWISRNNSKVHARGYHRKKEILNEQLNASSEKSSSFNFTENSKSCLDPTSEYKNVSSPYSKTRDRGNVNGSEHLLTKHFYHEADNWRRNFNDSSLYSNYNDFTELTNNSLTRHTNKDKSAKDKKLKFVHDLGYDRDEAESNAKVLENLHGSYKTDQKRKGIKTNRESYPSENVSAKSSNILSRHIWTVLSKAAGVSGCHDEFLADEEKVATEYLSNGSVDTDRKDSSRRLFGPISKPVGSFNLDRTEIDDLDKTTRELITERNSRDIFGKIEKNFNGRTVGGSALNYYSSKLPVMDGNGTESICKTHVSARTKAKKGHVNKSTGARTISEFLKIDPLLGYILHLGHQVPSNSEDGKCSTAYCDPSGDDTDLSVPSPIYSEVRACGSTGRHELSEGEFEHSGQSTDHFIDAVPSEEDANGTGPAHRPRKTAVSFGSADLEKKLYLDLHQHNHTSNYNSKQIWMPDTDEKRLYSASFSNENAPKNRCSNQISRNIGNRNLSDSFDSKKLHTMKNNFLFAKDASSSEKKDKPNIYEFSRGTYRPIRVRHKRKPAPTEPIQEKSFKSLFNFIDRSKKKENLEGSVPNRRFVRNRGGKKIQEVVNPWEGAKKKTVAISERKKIAKILEAIESNNFEESEELIKCTRLSNKYLGDSAGATTSNKKLIRRKPASSLISGWGKRNKTFIYPYSGQVDNPVRGSSIAPSPNTLSYNISESFFDKENNGTALLCHVDLKITTKNYTLWQGQLTNCTGRRTKKYSCYYDTPGKKPNVFIQYSPVYRSETNFTHAPHEYTTFLVKRVHKSLDQEYKYVVVNLNNIFLITVELNGDVYTYSDLTTPVRSGKTSEEVDGDDAHYDLTTSEGVGTAYKRSGEKRSRSDEKRRVKLDLVITEGEQATDPLSCHSE